MVSSDDWTPDLPFRDLKRIVVTGRKTAPMTARLVLIAFRQVLRLLLISCRSSLRRTLSWPRLNRRLLVDD